jgi:two-component system, chemotaxis family, sensor histidine kinase and response regulator WspE
VTDQNPSGPADHAILDLFREEVERHASAIADGLTALEKHPDTTDRLDGMIRAVHAIKGGAQIVELDSAVGLSRAMETTLVAAQKDAPLERQGIHTLQKGVDMLIRMARSASAPDWLEQHEDEIGRLIAAVTACASLSPKEEGAAQPARTTIKPIGDSAPPAKNDAAPAPKTAVADPAMMVLFQTEVQNHIAILNDGLLTLEKAPGATDGLDSLIRAAHSIRGAARIVGNDAAAKVSQAMEDCFSAVQKGQTSLTTDQIRILLKGVDVLNQLTGTAANGKSPDVPQEEIEAVTAAIRDVLSDGVPTGSEVSVEAPRPDAVPSREGEAAVQREIELVDPTMLDLFQTEVETHVAVLNDGLLALESNPEATDQLEALMRAAHSIKGGARVLGLDVAVRAAHVMEDCFVAAQKGVVFLGPDQIDILLRVVDILTQLAHSLSSGETDWLSRHREEIDRLVAAISAIINGEEAIPVSPVDVYPAQPTGPPSEEAAEPVRASSAEEPRLPAAATSDETLPQQHVPEKDRTVRVTAGKIERLMGQAGEVVVNARWLPAFSEALLELKRNHGELLMILDGLQETLVQEGTSVEASDLVLQARTKTKECNRKIGERLNQFDLFQGASEALSDRLYHEVISVRMRPFADGVQGFPRLVRDIARELGKKVRLDIRGKTTEVDRDILEKLDAPLNHLLRNAVDHGIESPEERRRAGKPEAGTLRLEAAHRSGMLMISLADDGRGMDLERLRQKVVEKGLAGSDMVEKMSEPELMDFLFLPGFSTARNVTEISGRGVGLDVVRNMVHDVGGVVRAISRPGEGMAFQMELPLTLSVVRTFLVEIAGEPYAFPLARIERCLELPRSEISTVEDRQYFRFDDNNIALVDIHNVLEMDPPPEDRDTLFVVVVSDRLNFYGLSVDRFVGEYDLVVRPLDPRLGKVPDISSVAVMLDGAPVLIFDVEDLVRSIDNLLTGRRLRKLSRETGKKLAMAKKRILVVDDSFTVREMERKLLESKGYHVETAVDGVDGWNAVRAGHYDMVVSDVDMPRMNGIEFIRQIKQHPEVKSLPVIIVSYKDKEEDRLLGLEAGANYYLTKSSFEDDSLIQAAVDLIGEA